MNSIKLTLATLAFLIAGQVGAHIISDIGKPFVKVEAQQTERAIKAIFNGNLKELKILVEEEGADPNFSLYQYDNIFHYITSSVERQAFDIEIPDEFSEQQIEAMQYLVDMGASVNQFNGVGGSTPLMFALEGFANAYPSCRKNLVKFFLENGADPDKGARSRVSHKVSSPFEVVSPFCGNETLEIYFSYKPDFVRGRCRFPSRIRKKNQEILDRYIGNGAVTPWVMLNRYFDSQGIPRPRIGDVYEGEKNPDFDKYKRENCPIL